MRVPVFEQLERLRDFPWATALVDAEATRRRGEGERRRGDRERGRGASLSLIKNLQKSR